MAEFSSPILGGIRVARRTISSSAFRSNAASAENSGETAALNRNQLALATISNQLTGISQQMRDLSASLGVLSNSIATDSGLERQREILKQNQERILAEQALRSGKESIIERKMQSALLAPAQKISQKAQRIFVSLQGFFITLLSGWLINQGIETLRALGQNNQKKLEGIRNNVLKNIAIIGGIYLALRGGFSLLTSIVSRTVGSIFNAVRKNLFVKPIEALLNAVKGAGVKLAETFGLKPKESKPTGGGGGKATAVESAIKGTAKGEVEGGILGIGKRAFSRLGGAARGFGLPLLTGSAFTAYDISKGEDPKRAVAGTVGGMLTSAAAFTLGSAIPIPGSGVVAGALAYGKGEEFSKGLSDKFLGTSAKAQPVTPKVEQKSQKKETEQDFSQKPKYGTMNLSLGQINAQDQQNQNVQESQKPEGTQTSVTFPSITSSNASVIFNSEALVQPLKSEGSVEKSTTVGPLPKAKPNVVVVPPSQQEIQYAPSGNTGGQANSVPNISASNPDNMYVLFSQMNYNVVF